jgi:DNA topoisomerase II
MKKPKFKVSDFYKDEFVDFASYSTIRMIGSAIDGMKNVHRKIFYTVLDKNIKNDIKLTQLNSKCAEYAEYLHGDMTSSIANLAQNFAGSNNLPMLAAEGNFGDRFTNEPSAGRYIYTYGLPILFNIIDKKDDPILIEQHFEGAQIEPRFYLPSLPMLLVNGSNGIASGYKQSILPRDPKAIMKYLKGRLNGTITKKKLEIAPYFEGFNGTVEKGELPNQWMICGTFKKVNTSTIEVTEIPVGIELAKYIKILHGLKDAGKIVSFKDNSNKNVFNFTIKYNRTSLAKLSDDQIMNQLKLIKKESELYNAVDENMNVRTFKNIHEIMDYYIDVKMRYMTQRKQALIDEMNKNIPEDISRYTFIKMIVTDKLVINKRATDVIIKDLDKADKIIKINDSYNYLLNMSIQSLTKEKMKALEEIIKEKKAKLKLIKGTSESDMWIDDLSNIKL